MLNTVENIKPFHNYTVQRHIRLKCRPIYYVDIQFVDKECQIQFLTN